MVKEMQRQGQPWTALKSSLHKQSTSTTSQKTRQEQPCTSVQQSPQGPFKRTSSHKSRQKQPCTWRTRPACHCCDFHQPEDDCARSELVPIPHAFVNPRDQAHKTPLERNECQGPFCPFGRCWSGPALSPFFLCAKMSI